jgi:hypothetical protein
MPVSAMKHLALSMGITVTFVRVIKTGGQAVIFEAIDDNTHRTYAIKEIALPLDPDQRLRPSNVVPSKRVCLPHSPTQAFLILISWYAD